jgi:hypothetical protein
VVRAQARSLHSPAMQQASLGGRPVAATIRAYSLGSLSMTSHNVVLDLNCQILRKVSPSAKQRARGPNHLNECSLNRDEPRSAPIRCQEDRKPLP